MKPALDDIVIPWGWSATAIHEDRIAFTRNEHRITLIAEPTDENPAMPELCTGQLWQLRCEQRVGEAGSGVPLDCVTTAETALKTLLMYMHQINEIAESENSISIRKLMERLETKSVTDKRDQ